jgi:hypothetical protein
VRYPPQHAVERKTIEVIQGPRYRVQDVRSASCNTVVLEKDMGFDPKTGKEGWRLSPRIEVKQFAIPIAGPIYRMQLQSTKKWIAYCERCTRISKQYTRMNEPAIKSWVTRHRCAEVSEGWPGTILISNGSRFGPPKLHAVDCEWAKPEYAAVNPENYPEVPRCKVCLPNHQLGETL